MVLGQPEELLVLPQRVVGIEANGGKLGVGERHFRAISKLCGNL